MTLVSLRCQKCDTVYPEERIEFVSNDGVKQLCKECLGKGVDSWSST